MISINFSALLYLVASVLFILSLKGLSSPTSARTGNYFGILGMGIAIITTILQPDTSNYFLVLEPKCSSQTTSQIDSISHILN